MLITLKGVGDVTKKKLNSLGLFTVRDILFRVPTKYIDLDEAAMQAFSSLSDGDYFKASGKVSAKSMPFRKGHLQYFKLTVEGEGGKGKFYVVWFNQNYMYKNFVENEPYTFFGKVKKKGRTIEFINPQYEKSVSGGKFCGVLPLYYTKGLIPQSTYREIIRSALGYKSGCESIITDEASFSLLPIADAFYDVHFPSNILQAECARRRLVLETTLRRLAAFRLEKQGGRTEKPFSYEASPDVISAVTDRLPYKLTETQEKTVSALISAVKKREPLNAIVCGDVGSGKTVVAVLLAYYAAKCGHQTAFMAPTELLALQHYHFLKKIIEPLGLKVTLLYAGLSAQEKRLAVGEIASGFTDIAVGTHSLLNDAVDFSDLSLVIVDEQHRFGVMQRTKLLDKGKNTDLLTLSATPIPRSMQLIAYGNVDYYTIEKRHEGNITTRLVSPENLDKMLSYIADVCRGGRQAFIVLPQIEDSEGCELMSAKGFFDRMAGEAFADLRVGLMHGKLKEREKLSVMNGFNSGELSVLVSTTVIEVGIDVQNASVIAVMNADRFGLATLHQLRGRVGRDGSRSYCFLYTEAPDTERLKKLVNCDDGFELAEYDFSERGGGDIFGTEQSGGGGIAGLTFKIIEESSRICDTLDLQKIRPLLRVEAEMFDLKNVSLN